MTVITLNEPTSVNNEDFSRYEKAGIRFGKKIGEKFTEAVIPDSQIKLARKLAKLPDLALKALQECIAYNNTPIQSAAHMASTLQALDRQNRIQDDGFPIPTSERPFTWSTNTLVPNEIRHLEGILKTRGVDEVRVGLEFETTTTEYPLEGYNKWKEIQSQILDGLEHESQSASEPKKSQLIAKKNAVAKFNAREVMMYDIIELDKRTKDIVEPIFGTERGTSGYYDAENVMELQLKHVPPHKLLENRRTLLKALYEKANEYGLVIEPPQQHESFSFWKDGKNILDHAHPDFLTTGKNILEGIARTLYDAYPMMIEPSGMERELGLRMESSTDREGYLRLADGRIEVRLAHHGPVQDAETMLPVVMAGAAYGIEPQDKKYHDTQLIEATHVRRGNFERTNDFKVIAHALQGALIEDNGRLHIPEIYLKASAEKIAEELGMLTEEYYKNKPSAMQQGFEGNKPPPFHDFLAKLFSDMRISDNGIIQWPDVGNIVPPGAQNPPNMEKLKGSMKCREKVDAFIIKPGYDLNDTSNVAPDMRINTFQHARMRRMKDSVPLAETTTVQFREALDGALEKQFGLPKISQVEKDNVRDLLRTGKWEHVPATNLFRLTLNNIDLPAFEAAFNEVRAEDFARYNLSGRSYTIRNTIRRDENSIMVFASPDVYERVAQNSAERDSGSEEKSRGGKRTLPKPLEGGWSNNT